MVCACGLDRTFDDLAEAALEALRHHALITRRP